MRYFHKLCSLKGHKMTHDITLEDTWHFHMIWNYLLIEFVDKSCEIVDRTWWKLPWILVLYRFTEWGHYKIAGTIACISIPVVFSTQPRKEKKSTNEHASTCGKIWIELLPLYMLICINRRNISNRKQICW